jgi:hypothetical protein
VDIAIGAFAWRVHGNSMTWAICCALLIADLLERTLRTLRAELALTTGVVLSVLAPANETLFATMTASVAIMPLVHWIRDRTITWRLALLTAIVLAVGVGLIGFTGGVMKTFLVEGNATHGASLKLSGQLELRRLLSTVPRWSGLHCLNSLSAGCRPHSLPSCADYGMVVATF